MKSAEMISKLLTFIRKYSMINENTGEDTTDPSMNILVGKEGKHRFYVVKTKALGDKSLLQHIVDNGPRMLQQREELLNLLVEKIETEYDDKMEKLPKASESKIITNLKLGLPTIGWRVLTPSSNKSQKSESGFPTMDALS